MDLIERMTSKVLKRPGVGEPCVVTSGVCKGQVCYGLVDWAMGKESYAVGRTLETKAPKVFIGASDFEGLATGDTVCVREEDLEVDSVFLDHQGFKVFTCVKTDW